MRSLQGLELLVTVLLARNRQPPPTAAAGGPHAKLAEELLTLPSGLLAMICEAIVKLKVRRGGCLCVRSCGCIGDGRGADDVPGACTAPVTSVGGGARLGLARPYAESTKHYE